MKIYQVVTAKGLVISTSLNQSIAEQTARECHASYHAAVREIETSPREWNNKLAKFRHDNKESF